VSRKRLHSSLPGRCCFFVNMTMFSLAKWWSQVQHDISCLENLPMLRLGDRAGLGKLTNTPGSQEYSQHQPMKSWICMEGDYCPHPILWLSCVMVSCQLRCLNTPDVPSTGRQEWLQAPGGD
jgi:hypothetical protein